MKTIRTIRCKVMPEDGDFPVLRDLFRRYAAALSEIAQWGRDHREFNSVRLHHALYYAVREKYGLPANLVVTALRRASGALKVASLRGKFEFRPTFVALDERTFTLFFNQESITFSTHVGRKKGKLVLGDYQREAIRTGIVRSAMLVWAKDALYANLAIETKVEQARLGQVLGVDLGIRKIAATSSNKTFDGKHLREYREFRWKVRASLQSKGTRGAKKVLRRLSGRERRHANWINHNIAKAIVEEALRSRSSAIALEDLSGIRQRLKVRNPHRNRMVSLWAYGGLRRMIQYKASMRGIGVVEISAYLSSLTCAGCGQRGSRREEVFECTPCGIVTDADVNAALVIAARGAAVNRPELDGQASRTAS